MIIEFSTEVSTYQVQDPDPNPDNEPYTYRGETGGTLDNVTASLAKDQTKEVGESTWGESLTKDMPEVGVGDTVHVVVALYSSGDTFGQDGGHTKVLDAFTDFSKAQALRDYAANRRNGEGFRFGFSGTEYYAPWAGYFEHLDSVTVWGVTVKPYHDYKYGT